MRALLLAVVALCLACPESAALVEARRGLAVSKCINECKEACPCYRLYGCACTHGYEHCERRCRTDAGED